MKKYHFNVYVPIESSGAKWSANEAQEQIELALEDFGIDHAEVLFVEEFDSEKE